MRTYGTPTFTSQPWVNSENYSYRGDLYMGSQDQLLQVVYDTGSGAFIVNSDECVGDDCPNTTAFSNSASTTFEWAAGNVT